MRIKALRDHVLTGFQRAAKFLTLEYIFPDRDLAALIAVVLVQVMLRLLNYVVTVYLIVVGLAGLNGLYHFIP